MAASAAWSTSFRSFLTEGRSLGGRARFQATYTLRDHWRAAQTGHPADGDLQMRPLDGRGGPLRFAGAIGQRYNLFHDFLPRPTGQCACIASSAPVPQQAVISIGEQALALLELLLVDLATGEAFLKDIEGRFIRGGRRCAAR